MQPVLTLLKIFTSNFLDTLFSGLSTLKMVRANFFLQSRRFDLFKCEDIDQCVLVE